MFVVLFEQWLMFRRSPVCPYLSLYLMLCALELAILTLVDALESLGVVGLPMPDVNMVTYTQSLFFFQSFCVYIECILYSIPYFQRFASARRSNQIEKERE